METKPASAQRILFVPTNAMRHGQEFSPFTSEKNKSLSSPSQEDKNEGCAVQVQSPTSTSKPDEKEMIKSLERIKSRAIEFMANPEAVPFHLNPSIELQFSEK
jgi:hypothetical protein